MPGLKLWLLGPPRFELDGQPVEIDRRKAVALLAYLAVTGQPHSRDALATLLWPEYDQTRARAALRRTLSVLNKALAGIWLDSDRENIALKQSDALWIDLQQFRQQLTQYHQHNDPDGDVCSDYLPLLTEAVALYQNDFLAGFSLRDSPGFDEWQFFQAENLRRELSRVLEHLVCSLSDQNEYDAAVTYARRWLELDPLQETVHRHLMQLYANSDQRPAALRQYQECVRILEQELGISPSEETTALYETIKTNQTFTPSLSPEHSTSRVLAIEPAYPERTLESTPQHLPSFLSTASEPSGPTIPFVGREEELAQLNHWLEGTLTNQGQVILITGQAGSGKTALVHEFARRAQERLADLIVGSGSCNAHTGLGDPYLPFREVLGLLTGDIESGWIRGTVTQENARRLWTLLPDSLQVIVELGPDLIDSFISSTALATQASILGYDQWNGLTQLKQLGERQSARLDKPKVEQSDLFEQFTNVLLALARQQPLLLVIDDAQWVDTTSVDLLFHLSRRLAGSRILMVIAYRPYDVALGRPSISPTVAGLVERHPLEAVINEIKRVYGDIQIDLDQIMDPRFVDAFIDVEPNLLGPEFRAALYQQTQGHPLFTIELLRNMQDRGHIIRDNQGWWVESQNLNWEALPARVEAVIGERISRLDEGLRNNLAVASVEGETFTVQVVAEIQKIDERWLLRSLSQELEKRHQLVQEQGEIQVNGRFLSRYRFSHTLFQQYLYQTLSAGERRLWHGDIALALEQIYARQIDEITVQLAHHYAEAGQVGKAVDYLLRSGDRARDMYAHQEAIGFYQKALAFLKEEKAYDRAARTLMKLGLTYHQAFKFKQARQAYGEGFTLWQRAGKTKPTPLPPVPHAFRRVWTDPPTLDPTMAYDTASGGIIDQLFSGLVALNPEMDVVPEIAQSWEVLEGGSKYIFHLRDDVYWSDGVPVTVNDFAYAWKRVLDPTFGPRNASYLFDIKGASAFYHGEISDPDHVGIRVLDEVTLLVELERPTSYFPQLAAQFIMCPVPRHVVEAHGEAWTEMGNIVTNGPFRLEQWQPGQSMILRRNPEYQGHFTGNVQQVELLLRKSSLVVQVELYQENRLDIVSLYSAPEMDRIRQQPAEEYFSGPLLNTQYLGLNVRTVPFNDPRVRQAFALAIDKETLASMIYLGYPFPALGGFVPPGMPGHSSEIGLPYDPKQARQLLAEAGYPAGRNFPGVEALIGGFRHEPESNYLREQWREILGVEIEWQIIDWDQLLDRLAKSPPHLFRNGWGIDYPDPDNPLRVAMNMRWTGWQHKTYTELVEQARRITNHEQRMRLYQQADRILIEEAAIIPLMYSRRHMLIKPWVSRYPMSPLKDWFWKDIIIEPH